MAKYGKKASEKVERAMHERKRGTLKSGSGRKVTSRKQAIAIGLSEAREAGGKVPPPKGGRKSAAGSRKSSGARKSSGSRKSSGARKSATSRKSSGTRKTSGSRTSTASRTRKTAKKR